MDSHRSNVILGADAILGPPTGIGNYARYLATELLWQEMVADLKLFLHGQLADATSLLLETPVSVQEPVNVKVINLRNLLASNTAFASVISKLAENKLAVWAYLGLLSFQRRWALKRYCQSHIYHSPNYLLPDFDGRKIVTIHDLSTVLFPEFHPPARVKLVNTMIGRTVESDAHIIVDSPTVASELCAQTGISPSRVSTVPLGVPSDFGAGEPNLSVLDEIGLEIGGYFLSVATIEPRKNILAVCRAYKVAKSADRSLPPIVFVGGEGWRSAREHEEIEDLVHRGWAKYLGYVPDGNLHSLYHGAVALVFASLYEGFGLPVIEAQACGARVITSKGTAMELLANSDDILIDPADVSSIADGLVAACSMFDATKKYIESRAIGVRRWSDVARETAGVYASL